MTHPATHTDVESAFRAFANAVSAADGAAFQALCARDVPPQQELFEKNAAFVREHHGSLVLRRVETQADVATVTFDVRAGAQAHSGHVVFTREPEGWRIRTL